MTDIEGHLELYTYASNVHQDLSLYTNQIFDQATEQTYSVETAPFKDGTFLSWTVTAIPIITLD